MTENKPQTGVPDNLSEELHNPTDSRISVEEHQEPIPTGCELSIPDLVETAFTETNQCYEPMDFSESQEPEETQNNSTQGLIPTRNERSIFDLTETTFMKTNQSHEPLEFSESQQSKESTGNFNTSVSVAVIKSHLEILPDEEQSLNGMEKDLVRKHTLLRNKIKQFFERYETKESTGNFNTSVTDTNSHLGIPLVEEQSLNGIEKDSVRKHTFLKNRIKQFFEMYDLNIKESKETISKINYETKNDSQEFRKDPNYVSYDENASCESNFKESVNKIKSQSFEFQDQFSIIGESTKYDNISHVETTENKDIFPDAINVEINELTSETQEISPNSPLEELHSSIDAIGINYVSTNTSNEIIPTSSFASYKMDISDHTSKSFELSQRLGKDQFIDHQVFSGAENGNVNFINDSANSLSDFDAVQKRECNETETIVQSSISETFVNERMTLADSSATVRDATDPHDYINRRNSPTVLVDTTLITDFLSSPNSRNSIPLNMGPEFKNEMPDSETNSQRASSNQSQEIADANNIRTITITAIQHSNNREGSTVLDIMGYIRSSIPSQNKNLSCEVRKALKELTAEGDVKIVRGKYVIAENTTQMDTSNPTAIKREMSHSSVPPLKKFKPTPNI